MYKFVNKFTTTLSPKLKQITGFYHFRKLNLMIIKTGKCLIRLTPFFNHLCRKE